MVRLLVEAKRTARRWGQLVEVVLQQTGPVDGGGTTGQQLAREEGGKENRERKKREGECAV